METEISFDKYLAVMNKTYFKRLGKVANVVGLTIESSGPDAKMGDLCKIYTDADKIILKKYKPSMTCAVTGDVSEDNYLLAGGKLVLSKEGVEQILKEIESKEK